MKRNPEIYIATVCLERNRWSSRQPSFRVSDWWQRFAADGFDGVELWENHFLAADEGEQAHLVGVASPLPIYNTYAGFTDGDDEHRRHAAAAIERLRAGAVKYNLGGQPDLLDVYRRNLLQWAQQLPPDCRLLCECHAGTVLERAPAAAAFLGDLDPTRFGVIVHAIGEVGVLEQWFTVLGERIAHLHVSMRDPKSDPTVPAGRELIEACFAVVKARSFTGTVSIEFTRGIGPDEHIETLYSNACADLAYCREILGLY